MRGALHVTALAAAVLALSACAPVEDGRGPVPPAGNASPTADGAPGTGPGQASAASGPASRGHEVVVPGTTVRHSTDIAGAELEMTVAGVEVLESCPGRGLEVEPRLGQFVVLDVRASLVGPDGGAPGADAFAALTPDVFGIAAPDGRVQEIVVTEGAWGCYEDAELLPPFVDPGETVRGKVVLDSATEHGWVIYAPEPTTGWEWKF
ncbi:hypothetical protein KZX45_14675 [Georgenia sp. EYE_87]|uniref:hypothetical protein n=1 Tax=Georgenia sp. EYE_87 TaxID=2853448 RepID=UPI0020030897|nr:hypothetical protein [Georgenia sp. EYE_87]MCK6211791.1 hypothetical protein [Georgenia sp. EYE_87]